MTTRVARANLGSSREVEEDRYAWNRANFEAVIRVARVTSGYLFRLVGTAAKRLHIQEVRADEVDETRRCVTADTYRPKSEIDRLACTKQLEISRLTRLGCDIAMSRFCPGPVVFYFACGVVWVMAFTAFTYVVGADI